MGQVGFERGFICAEHESAVSRLRDRLDDFYRTTTAYDAFNSVNTQPVLWAPIVRDIELRARTISTVEKVRVLEFGAGRTGFGTHLGGLRDRVDFHVQDVTAQNTEHLKRESDRVFVGDVLEMSGPYDVVFSTFVWEHVSNPVRVLTHLLSLLSVGGRLYLASPRYDLPGYVPPSARHYGLLSKVRLVLGLSLRRVRTRFGGKPGFLIHVDPALFHKPWYRDSDAIHWASLHDLRRALPANFRLSIARSGLRSGLKGWIWQRFCLLNVTIERLSGEQPVLRGLESAR